MNITSISTSQLPNIFTDIFADLFERRNIAIDGENTFPRIEALDDNGIPRKVDLYRLATDFAKEIC